MRLRVEFLVVALPWLLPAQATVEAALGAGRAGVSAAPAQKTGKSIAGVFDSLNQTLQNSAKPKSSARKNTATPKHTVPAGPRTTSTSADKPNTNTTSEAKFADSFEDPSGIEEGMVYAEIARRYGPPSLKLTTSPGEETLCYWKQGLSVEATVRNGKIAVVRKSGASDQAPPPTPKR